MDFFAIGEHKLSDDDISRFPNYNVVADGYQFGKIRVLHKILSYILATSTVPCKIMIFTDYHRYIQDFLSLNYGCFDIGYLALCGNKKDIDKLVLAYKRGFMSILVSNPSMYGCGMNFENTTDLILMHNVEYMDQVIGRAQRYGRSLPLKIWHIQYENEKNMISN